MIFIVDSQRNTNLVRRDIILSHPLSVIEEHMYGHWAYLKILDPNVDMMCPVITISLKISWT